MKQPEIVKKLTLDRNNGQALSDEQITELVLYIAYLEHLCAPQEKGQVYIKASSPFDSFVGRKK